MLKTQNLEALEREEEEGRKKKPPEASKGLQRAIKTTREEMKKAFQEGRKARAKLTIGADNRT